MDLGIRLMTVLGPLIVLFIVVPFVELFVIIEVGQRVGAPATIGLLVAVSVAGGWLVRREGLGTLRRAQARMRMGEVPGSELVDGLLILFAGALLLTPGFLTDLLAISLLIPPVRAAVRRVARRSLRKRVAITRFSRHR
jgi:UPF0716 protein FxsA